MPIRVIPVLDLKAGQAVHAIGGERSRYRPLRTRLHADPDPIGVARGVRDVLRLQELYLADLDAIAGAAPSVALYRSIRSLGLNLWVDAGVRDRSSLPPLLGRDVGSLVVGLETVRGPEALAEVVAATTPGRLLFSLDLRAGLPLFAGDGSAWGTTDPFTLACSAVALGVRRLLLLDLARVGTGRGTGTLPLLVRLRAAHPALELAVGGGICDRDEISALSQAGADAILIGSALHDGRLGAAELAELKGPGTISSDA
jgi:phosphoribosylformimino-5-aminoimidazole carboxamide ribotide isomerase